MTEHRDVSRRRDALLPNAVEEVVRAWHPVWRRCNSSWRISTRRAPARRNRSIFAGADARRRHPRSILEAGGYVGVPTSGNAFARTVLERLLPLPESEWRQAADTSLEIIAPFLGDVVSLRKTSAATGFTSPITGCWVTSWIRASCASRSSSICSANGRWLSSRVSSGFTIPRNWAAREPAHLNIGWPLCV